MSGHVFVSHSSDNRDLANELAAFLEARGVRVWIAPRDVRPGMDYSEQLQLAIEKAAAFVVLVTEMANKSPYVRAETEMAFSTHKPLFPVRISEIQPAAGLALFLKIRHWTDAYGASRSANLDRLAVELQALTAPPAPAVEAPAPEAAAPQAAAAATAPLAAAAVASPGVAGPAAGGAAAAPPRPKLPTAPANAEEEEKWRAAVGPRADLYLLRWKQMAERNSAVSWNWSACLANLFWFAYRKMWIPAGAMAVVYIANIALMTNEEVAGIVALLSLGATFVTGTFGTFLYRQQTAKLVAATAGQEKAAALDTLRKRGGVSQPALWGAIGFLVVLLVVAGAIVQRQQRINIQPPAPYNPTPPPVDPSQPPAGDKPVGPEPPFPEEPLPQEPMPEEPLPEEPPPEPAY